MSGGWFTLLQDKAPIHVLPSNETPVYGLVRVSGTLSLARF